MFHVFHENKNRIKSMLNKWVLDDDGSESLEYLVVKSISIEAILVPVWWRNVIGISIVHNSLFVCNLRQWLKKNINSAHCLSQGPWADARRVFRSHLLWMMNSRPKDDTLSHHTHKHQNWKLCLRANRFWNDYNLVIRLICSESASGIYGMKLHSNPQWKLYFDPSHSAKLMQQSQTCIMHEHAERE